MCTSFCGFELSESYHRCITYIRFFFVLYWFGPYLKFGSLPSENPIRAPVLDQRTETYWGCK